MSGGRLRLIVFYEACLKTADPEGLAGATILEIGAGRETC